MGWEQVEFKEKLYTKWVVPKKVAGWHEASALPGTEENVVLSGHHNTEGKVFRYVVDLKPGDELQLYVGDIPYLYYVAEKYILKEAGMPLDVRRANAQWIKPTGDERLTLVTCWPYEWPGTTHRVIVVARPASYFQELANEAKDSGSK
jgi:LPXTG-site transpeptidase (sortase) family protein